MDYVGQGFCRRLLAAESGWTMKADRKSARVASTLRVNKDEPHAPVTVADWMASPKGRTTTSATLSALVHGALLLLLGLYTTATVHGQKGGISLLASATAGDMSSDGKLDTPPELDSFKSTLRPSVTQPAMTAMASGATRPAINSASLSTVKSGGSGEGSGAKGATFFGAVSVGKGFVYVIDNSNSMKAGKFEKACAELINSINELSSSQSYYVIFFSDQAYPLHAPKDVPMMLPAISLNTLYTQHWIKQQELHRGTRAHQAFEKALSLNPDAIYVLTDGHFTDNTDAYLLGLKNNKIPIHAIGFGKSRASGEDSLRKIVEMHHGLYTFVPVK